MARHGARGSIVLIVFGRVTTRRTCTVIPGLESHKINESHDGPRYEYEACSDLFSNCASAKQHMYNKDHWRKHYYQPCGKGLESERNSNAVNTPNYCSRVETDNNSNSTAEHIVEVVCLVLSPSVASPLPQDLRTILRLDPAPTLVL